MTGLSVFGGLDLCESADMTALVLAHVDPTDGVWHMQPLFWLPEERLAEKAGRDRAPYDLWRDRGFLETTPGPLISYEDVAERLKEVFEDYQVTKIAFDQWHFDTFRPWLIKAGFSEQTIKEKFVEFGQGYRSMSPALRDLERPDPGEKAAPWLPSPTQLVREQRDHRAQRGRGPETRQAASRRGGSTA